MDRSIILMFWPGCSGLAWCSSNMVLCTIDWNAKLHRFGSSYIRPWKKKLTIRCIGTQRPISKVCGCEIPERRCDNDDVLTKKLWPCTSCHLCTGSLARNTFGQFANCSKNVVFPLPTFPSTNTVYGRLQYSLTAMSARVLEINSAVMSLTSYDSRPGQRRDVFDGWTRGRESGGAQRSNDVVVVVDRPRERQHKHNEFIAFNRQNVLSPLTGCCCCGLWAYCVVADVPPLLSRIDYYQINSCAITCAWPTTPPQLD